MSEGTRETFLEAVWSSGLDDSEKKRWALQAEKEMVEAKAENERLKTAIRTHRDKRGDDRCWIDDHELYSVLGEPFDTHTKNLPYREEFLISCERYWKQRQPTGAPITEHPPDPEDMSDPSTLTIGQLEREVERIQNERREVR